jgi:hypothetical protein
MLITVTDPTTGRPILSAKVFPGDYGPKTLSSPVLNGLDFEPDGPYRVRLTTPGWTKDGMPLPNTHGIDHPTAMRLLSALILAIANISPSPGVTDPTGGYLPPKPDSAQETLFPPEPAHPNTPKTTPKTTPKPGVCSALLHRVLHFLKSFLTR